MQQKIFKDTMMAFLLAFALTTVCKAQGVPTYFELVEPGEELVDGKHYLMVTDYKNTTQEITNIAYNGYDQDKKLGKTGTVNPSNHPIPIINTALPGNAAEPVLLQSNGEGGWFIKDASGSNRYLCANASDVPSLAHNIEWTEAMDTPPGDNPLCQWTITQKYDDVEETYYWDVMNKGKGSPAQRYYMKYYDNNGQGMFRLYTGSGAATEDNERIHRLYKELDPVPVMLGFTGYGTLYYSDKNLLVCGENVEAHTCTRNGMQLSYSTNYPAGDLSLASPNNTIVPMGHAVIITGAVNGGYTFHVTKNTGETDAANILSGRDSQGMTTVQGNTDDYYFYKLTTYQATEGVDNGTTGFYWGGANGGPFRIPAHKAYLVLDKSVAQSNQAFLFDTTHGSVNAITQPTVSEHQKDIYDLQGRRYRDSGSLPKGVYVKNGRKVVVR